VCGLERRDSRHTLSRQGFIYASSAASARSTQDLGRKARALLHNEHGPYMPKHCVPSSLTTPFVIARWTLKFCRPTRGSVYHHQGKSLKTQCYGTEPRTLKTGSLRIGPGDSFLLPVHCRHCSSRISESHPLPPAYSVVRVAAPRDRQIMKLSQAHVKYLIPRSCKTVR